MITIEENVSLVIDDIVSLARPKKIPKIKSAAKAIHEFREAYKKVYGILPEIKFDGIWYRIKGHDSGVKLTRLKEMTSQLNYRSGAHV